MRSLCLVPRSRDAPALGIDHDAKTPVMAGESREFFMKTKGSVTRDRHTEAARATGPIAATT
jgi:hypothetical protein